MAVERLTAGYGRARRTTPVLQDLTLHLAPGTSTAVVGVNGAGKTTLVRVLLGLVPPRSGRVRIGGRTPGAYRRSGDLGYVPEDLELPPGWTVRELLAESARLRGYRGLRRQARCRSAVRALGLDEMVHDRVEALSRGSARRVALASAVVGRRPGLVLLDEPLSGLDARSRDRVRRLVVHLRRRGATVLVTTHELREVPGLADIALVLARGTIASRLTGRALSTLEEAVREGETDP